MNKIPSKSTILRILNMVNAELVSLCTVDIMRELFGIDGDIVAVDGKTICSTAKMNRCSMDDTLLIEVIKTFM